MQCTAKITPEVRDLLEKQRTWTLATCGDEVNAIPIFFTTVTACGKLVLGDVFMNQTIKNLEMNNRVAVSVYEGLTGYQLKGTVRRETQGELFDQMS